MACLIGHPVSAQLKFTLLNSNSGQETAAVSQITCSSSVRDVAQYAGVVRMPSHLQRLSGIGIASTLPKTGRNAGVGAYKTGVRCSAAGSSSAAPPSDDDPYKVLGISPLSGFEVAQVAHRKKKRIAEQAGDSAELDRLEAAYDRIMMGQLARRRKGLTFGSVEVSKEIKYADAKDYFPWRPRKELSSKNDVLINLGISAALGGWILVTGRAGWRPLQLILFAYIFRVFTKLQKVLPTAVAAEGEEKTVASRQRMLRALGLVFGVVGFVTVGYSALLYAFVYLGSYPPEALVRGQELAVTLASSIGLFFISSFYR